LFIIRCNLIVFELNFAYANKDIDNNIEDAFNIIFVYVDKDIEDDVASKRVRNVFNIEVERNINDVCEITFDDKNCFIKIISMHAIANINILEEDNFASNIEDNIEDVLILIIVKISNVELDFAKTQMHKMFIQIKTISIAFFA
jgi:hypothetical protein